MKLNALRNKKGAALLWVILMTIIITILLGAVLAATYAYFNYTMYTVKRQQAYFTARSAIAACVEEFTSVEQERDTETGSYVDKQISILPNPNSEIEITDFGFDPKMGKATAKISRNDDDEITVKVTATYADQQYTMKASVARMPLTFGGIAVKNLTLGGNLSLAAGTDFYWNNEEIFDTSCTDTSKAMHTESTTYKLTVNGNFVSKGDAKITTGTTIANHKFKQDVTFQNDGKHSKKIWSPSEYIISNKTLMVDDESSTEYTSSVLNTLSRITDTHPKYCNNHHENPNFGSKIAVGSNSAVYKVLTALGLSNIYNDIADENMNFENSENDAMAIQYIEILSLSTTISNAVADQKANSRTLIGNMFWSTIDSSLNALDKLTYDTLDVSYFNFKSTDENNRLDEVVPLTYMFVRGGTNKGLTVRVRYGAEPGKRSTIGQITDRITDRVEGIISDVFAIDNKPSYMVIYLEENSTIHLGYDGDGLRNDNPQDLIFLYSIYGGKNTKVVLHDGVTVVGEIICDKLEIDGDVNIIYSSTNGAQVAKQKIAEYWAVNNYSD